MGREVPGRGGVSAIWVLGGAFLLGGLVGCLLAGLVRGGGGDSLSAYLQNYLAALGADRALQPNLLALIWEQARWPLFVLILGLTAFALPGLPALFAVRGFLLAFSAGSFVRLLGASGGLLALILFGLSGLLAIPVFFMLGVRSWERARGEPEAGGPLPRLALCGLSLCACVCLELFVTPMLLRNAASFLL